MARKAPVPIDEEAIRRDERKRIAYRLRMEARAEPQVYLSGLLFAIAEEWERAAGLRGAAPGKGGNG